MPKHDSIVGIKSNGNESPPPLPDMSSSSSSSNVHVTPTRTSPSGIVPLRRSTRRARKAAVVTSSDTSGSENPTTVVSSSTLTPKPSSAKGSKRRWPTDAKPENTSSAEPCSGLSTEAAEEEEVEKDAGLSSPEMVSGTPRKQRRTFKSGKTSKGDAVPSPQRPTPEECAYVVRELGALHPHVVERQEERRRRTLLESCGFRNSVAEAVISTVLSQNTTDKNSKAAFDNLRQVFGANNSNEGDEWLERVADCPDVTQIEAAIRVAGLAKTRAARIQSLLRTVKEEQPNSRTARGGVRSACSMEYLRDLSTEHVKQELGRFPGLGPKTISCVLLFGLGRAEFPVDTHVCRIAQKMGWLSGVKTSREEAYRHLNQRVPDDLKLDLHCLLVAHGKVCHSCAANGRPQFPPANHQRIDCPLTTAKLARVLAPATTIVAPLPETVTPDAAKSEQLETE